MTEDEKLRKLVDENQATLRQMVDTAFAQCLKFVLEFPGCWSSIKVTTNTDLVITVGIGPKDLEDD